MDNKFIELVKNANLTPKQQKIAEYFIHNPDRIVLNSSADVAGEIGVSDASVIRFARAIGYDGFADLKKDVYNDLAARATEGTSSLSLTDRFEANRAIYGDNVTRADFLDLARFNMERTFRQNDDERFDAAVAMLLNARNRYIVGMRGCLGVAGQCAWLLRFCLDHVISVTDEGPGGVGLLQDICPDDCALFFLFSRYYESDVRLIGLARERGAKICLITNSMLSPLTEMADVLLLAETRNMSFFNTTVASNLISEYLIARVAHDMDESYRQKAAERDLLTKDMRL